MKIEIREVKTWDRVEGGKTDDIWFDQETSKDQLCSYDQLNLERV